MGSMNGTGLSRSSPAGLSRSGLLALLLVGALLLCYEANGPLHKISDIDLLIGDPSSSIEKGTMGEHSGKRHHVPGGARDGHLGSVARYQALTRSRIESFSPLSSPLKALSYARIRP